MSGWVGLEFRSSCSLIRWKETELYLRIFSHIYTLCVITHAAAVRKAAVRKAETTRLSSLISCHGCVTSATRELEKNVQIRMHQRDSEPLPKKLRQGATWSNDQRTNSTKGLQY